MISKSVNYLLTATTLFSSGIFFSSIPAEAHSFDYCIDVLQEEAEISVTGTSQRKLEQKHPEEYQEFAQDCEQELKRQGFITISQVKENKKLANSVRNGILVLDSLDPVKVQQQQDELKQSEASLDQQRQDICAKNDPATDYACRPQIEQQREQQEIEQLNEQQEIQKEVNPQSAPTQANSVLVAAVPQVSDMLSQWTLRILKPISPLVSFITGNGGDRTRDTSSSPASADLVAQAGPSSPGTWGTVFKWPLVAVHMAVIPDRRVLAWTRPKLSAVLNTPQYTVWNPANGSFTNGPAFGKPGALKTDIFCAGHDFAPSGNLLVAGGHENETSGHGSRDINIFSFSQNKWLTPSIKAMAKGRWYPTVTYNALGEGVIVGGSIINENNLNSFPEVWGRDGSKTTPLNGAELALPVKPYVWNFLAPSGRIFNVGPPKITRALTTAKAGTWSDPISTNGFGDRFYGTAVMYDSDNGRVIRIGGSKTAFDLAPPTNTAETIDLSKSTDWVRTKNDMAFRRRHHTATLLADGKVFVAGGTSLGDFNNPDGRPPQGEIWDPATGLWRTVASMDNMNGKLTRSYHTTAVLLPDATVLVAGGGLPAVKGKGDDLTEGNYNAQIYRPPYLSNGGRPTISDANTIGKMVYGQPFKVNTPNAASITKVHLIRLSSMTHQFNMGQRLNSLTILSRGSNSLTVKAPTPNDKNKTPPGHYMLFILNGQGVPSVAKIVRIS